MRRLFVVIAVMLLVSFAACKKVKGPANGNSVQPNNNLDSLVSMSAMINGHLWQTDSAFGSYVMLSGNDSGVVNLMITATRKKNDSVSTIVFHITNFTGINTYTINPPANTATYYLGNMRHYATSGAIIVTNDSGSSLIGTFHFAADTISVSNGTFNVSLP
ncbi:MAG: hypothetical protein ACHQD8_02475 [Chitinophagales bacterium]